MKSIKIILIGAFLFSCFQLPAQGILGKIKDKVKQRVENNENKAIDKGLDKTEDAIKNDNSNSGNNSGSNSSSGSGQSTSVNSGNSNNTGSMTESPKKATDLKVYQNFDFIPGEKIIFEDNFTDDLDGEFPSHWKLLNGQAVINKVDGKEALLVTDGNYGLVRPRMKNDNYLPANFTLEFDLYFTKNQKGETAYGPRILFYNADGSESRMRIGINESSIDIGQLTKSYSEEIRNSLFNKWHHVSIILKNGQMKVYLDQTRICVNPDIEKQLFSLSIGGIGYEKLPIIISNVKLAEGGGMNIIGQKFTDTKIVTHGIRFDVNKSIIKPESMGTLNGIVKILTDNPDLKFEIGGHTDSDGDDAANLKLSQERADAVKAQLVSMGISEGRLTTKGYGKTKPIADNASLEGKAMNRRVEFVKN